DHFPKGLTRDYWLNKLLTEHTHLLASDVIAAVPLFFDQTLSSRWALKGMDLSYEENNGFVSQDQEIEYVLKLFPKPSNLRDDVLLQTMERWVHDPDEDRVSQYLYQDSEQMRQRLQQKGLFADSLLFILIPNLRESSRVELLLWLMGVVDNKPAWLQRLEG